MHTVWNFTRSTGGSALLIGIALGMTAGVLLDDIHHVLLAIAVLAVAAIGTVVGIAIHRARRQVDRIVREEVDEPREHADELQTYDLTVTNPHDPTSTPSTYRHLTIGRLADHLDRHDVRTYLAEADAATVTAPDGHQLTWQPSTDTTGETR